MPGQGFIASPGAIRRYGAAVARQEGRLAGIDSGLAAVRLPGGAFGKLPEAGELYAAYTAHANAVLAVTARLPGDIASVAQALYGTASSYEDTESGMAEGIRQLFGTPAGPARVPGRTLKTFTAIVSDTENAYSWVNEPEESLPALATGLDGAGSGLSGLLDAGINWVISHVPELPRLLDDVTGNMSALEAAAAAWHDQGTALNDVIRALKEPAASLPEAWAGSASAAFGGFMSGLTQALADVAGEMGQTQQILQDAAKESAFAHDTIVMIISEVVEWVAGNLLVDAMTLGLATGLEAAGTAAWLGTKVEQAEQAASRLAAVYRALSKIVESLQKAKDGLKGLEGLAKLRQFTTLGDTFMGEILGAGKLKNLRMLGEGRLASAAQWIWGAGQHAEGIPGAMELGRTGVLTTTAVKAAAAGTIGLTGLSSSPGLKGLAEDLVTGNLSDISGNAQGAAEAMHLSAPPIPPAPPASRIERLLGHAEPEREP